MSSTNFSASAPSGRLAPVRRTASGVPLPSTSRWRLVPFLARSVGFGPVSAPKNGAEGLAVHAAMLPVDALLLPDPLQQGVQEFLPDAFALPVPQPAPAGHAGAAAHLLREHLPGDAALQDEDNAGQAGAVVHRRSAAFTGLSPVARQERLDDFPQFVGDKGASHGAPPVGDNYPLLFYGALFLLEFLIRYSLVFNPP